MAKGRLVATGDRVLLFDVKTGKLVHLARCGQVSKATAGACWPATGSTGRPGTRSRSSTSDPACGPSRRSSSMEVYQHDRRQPGRRRRLPRRGADRRSGRLLPEQPPDRTLSRRDRARRRTRRPRTIRLARAAEAVGQDQLALESYEQASPARAGRPRPSTACRWPRPRADHQFRLLARRSGQARRRRQARRSPPGLEAAARVSPVRRRSAQRGPAAVRARDRGEPARGRRRDPRASC